MSRLRRLPLNSFRNGTPFGNARAAAIPMAALRAGLTPPDSPKMSAGLPGYEDDRASPLRADLSAPADRVARVEAPSLAWAPASAIHESRAITSGPLGRAGK